MYNFSKRAVNDSVQKGIIAVIAVAIFATIVLTVSGAIFN